MERIIIGLLKEIFSFFFKLKFRINFGVLFLNYKLMVLII